MRYECQDCQIESDDLADFHPLVGDLDRRINAGEIVPVAECRKCGAVVHDNQCKPIRAERFVELVREWFWQEDGEENEVGGADTVDYLIETLVNLGFGPPSHPENMIRETPENDALVKYDGTGDIGDGPLVGDDGDDDE